MSNADAETPEVQTDALSTLDGLLRQYRVAPPTGESSADYRTILLYLGGELTQQQARALERRLLDSSLGRRRLREARAASSQFSTLTWAEIQLRASEGDALATAWASLVRERTRLLAQNWQNIGQRLQEDFRKVWADTGGEARSLWSGLQAFVLQWKRERQWDAAIPALARGNALPSATHSSFRLSVNADADGALTAVVGTGDIRGAQDDEVELFLNNGTGELPLGGRSLARDPAEWRLPGLAHLLGLPPGPVSASLFRIGRATERSALSPLQRERYLIAEIMDAAGEPLPHESAMVIVTEFPRIEGETLLFETTIDAPTRRAYAGYRIAIECLLWEDRPVYLGAWPLSEWQEAPRRLLIPFPGVESAPAAVYIPLRMRLYPGDLPQPGSEGGAAGP